jgi:pyridoxamine 5'-phosphate oxidase
MSGDESRPEDPLRELRHEYADRGLDEGDLDPDPVVMFRRWFDEARDGGIHEPNAMVLATASPDGRPSSRMVLLKGHDAEGFVFFTNRRSRKGEELAANPRCALLFPWHPLERQVRVEGSAVPLSSAEVADYFAARPRGSRLGAHASRQSRPVADRAELQAAYDAAQARFEGGEVPVPEEWGGYRVVPDALEFWQGRPGRMHDRHVYRRESGGRDAPWTVQRLAP